MIPQTSAGSWTSCCLHHLSVRGKRGSPASPLHPVQLWFVVSWTLRFPPAYFTLACHGAVLDRCMLFVLPIPLCLWTCVCVCVLRWHSADRRFVSLCHSDRSALRQQPKAQFSGVVLSVESHQRPPAVSELWRPSQPLGRNTDAIFIDVARRSPRGTYFLSGGGVCCQVKD